MRDMKNDRLTMLEKHEDALHMVKIVADGLVLFALLIVLCIVAFSLTPYIGG